MLQCNTIYTIHISFKPDPIGIATNFPACYRAHNSYKFSFLQSET